MKCGYCEELNFLIEKQDKLKVAKAERLKLSKDEVDHTVILVIEIATENMLDTAKMHLIFNHECSCEDKP